ncbi:VanZ family protein [Ramlibacter sp. 2FC]|uniref:VanZ family protein n=1 Tax=Ramlibacter sp. 2FC TaxID=2502188 RepID=UPI0010FA2F1E|nr:VanZ family protein [Ramlibacter sp. 2FC]
MAHKSSAWPLALIYAALIVYASLYPFADWRDQGLAPWSFLWAPLPRYWTGFDLAANVVGYGPLGFLLALGLLRTRPRWPAVALATLAGGGLSLLLESLQAYLPVRVSSNLDLGLNLLGAGAGAAVAWTLERLGALDRWSRFRARWFDADARGALVLLALWPAALLFPAPVPLGLGQVLERAEEALAEWLADTPFLEWLPLRELELEPLLPGAELLCVMLGALIPCLLGYSVIRAAGRRLLFAVVFVVLGLGASALSAALSYGPAHAWAWLSVPVRVGLVAAAIGSLLLLPVPRRGCTALALLALVLHLSLLNHAPTSAYFAQTLQTWEQGRFIRFHGLAQWLGWLWPFAALAYVLLRLSRGEAPEEPARRAQT